jgi:hypothetical protein
MNMPCLRQVCVSHTYHVIENSSLCTIHVVYAIPLSNQALQSRSRLLTYLMLQRQLSHLNGHKLDRRQITPLIFSTSRFALSSTVNMFIPMIPCDFCFLPAQSCYITVYIWTVESPGSLKKESKICYDRRSVGQSVMVSRPHQWPRTRFLLPSDRFVDVGRPLWRENGSVVYNCCCSSPQQTFSSPSPEGLRTIFYSLGFETSGPGGPGSHFYIPQEQGRPVIPPGTGFPFRRLLRLGGIRWRYLNPLPRGSLGSLKDKIALRLESCRPSVRPGVKPLETHERGLSSTEPLRP